MAAYKESSTTFCTICGREFTREAESNRSEGDAKMKAAEKARQAVENHEKKDHPGA